MVRRLARSLAFGSLQSLSSWTRRLVALSAYALTVAVTGFVSNGRSAVGLAVIAPFGVLFAVWLWRAARAAHRQRGLRRFVAYAAVAALAVVELWMLAIIALLAAVPAEALFPFELEKHP